MQSHQPITVGEAARILRVSEGTVRRFDASGALPATRTGAGVRIFDRAAVERFASERAQRTERRGQ